jgi:hypothetical protein
MITADKGGRRGASERKAGLPGRGRRGGMAHMFRLSSFRAIFAGALLLAAGAGRLAADLAADIARVSVEAAGGAKAHAALRSFRAVGTTRVGDQEVSFVLHAARPDRLRIETLGDKGNLIRAFDGVHAPWKRVGLLEPPKRLGEAEEREFLRETDYEQPLYDWERRGVSLDFAGEAVVDGRPCQKLLAVFKHTQPVTLYVDDETHLVIRRDETRRLKGGRAIVIETRFGEFRETAGVMLPRRVRTIIDGKLNDETRIEAINPNPSLPADFFRPPAPDWPKR